MNLPVATVAQYAIIFKWGGEYGTHKNLLEVEVGFPCMSFYFRTSLFLRTIADVLNWECS